MRAFTRAVAGAAGSRAVRRLVTRTRAGRALVRRFVAGEDLDAATAVARRLGEEGRQVSLDLLGEEVTDGPTARAAFEGYLACLERIGGEALDANISVKLTHLGLEVDPSLAADHLDRLAAAAAEVGTTVTVDMEDSRFTAATVDLYEEQQRRHGNLGVCLQAYLHRTPDDLARLAPLGGHIRLCKGAYLEPPEVALQSRARIERAFLQLLEQLMRQEAAIPAVATHDLRLIARGEELAASRPGRYEFQMLYGVRPRVQDALVERGRPLRVYVPYGSEWYAYLTRRLAERPANLLFLLRALLRR